MESKPFWLSKKWWMSALAMVGSLLAVILGALPQEHKLYGVIAGVAAAIGYVTAQGKVDAVKALPQNPPAPPSP